MQTHTLMTYGTSQNRCSRLQSGVWHDHCTQLAQALSDQTNEACAAVQLRAAGMQLMYVSEKNDG